MPGISYAELLPVFSALGLDSLSRLSIADGEELTGRHVSPFPADVDLVLVNVRDVEAARAVLLNTYPPGHRLRVVDADGVGEVILAEWRHQSGSVYVPALTVGHSAESFHEIIAHLRAPNGCPWDRKQTHSTLREYLVEETYEVLDAIDLNDAGKMAEELGDVLLQVFLHAQIAYEYDEFRLGNVYKEIYDKIIRRHPHVFGDVTVDGVGEVLTNWESIKKEERKQKGEERKSLLDGAPKGLPGLMLATEYQKRAAKVGFDWPGVEGVLEKIREEIVEIQEADKEALPGEFGDLLFALVNLARWKKVDAEAALRETNRKFKRRFAHIERRAEEAGKAMADLSLDEMEAWWQEAKGLE